MYTNIRSIQLLISLLKQFNIKYIVLSPGGSDIPIIHSIESDPYFECFSVVDERSAAYFAMGVAQMKESFVACVCTSGTAVSNYLPGLTEAYHQNVPIIAITADKNPFRTYQLETQKIEQRGIFGSICKISIDLPIINTEEEQWYCERIINEALLEINHHGTGPIHINVPVMGDMSSFNCETLPKARKINRIETNGFEVEWEGCKKELEKAQRVLVVVGQNVTLSNNDINNMEKFFESYNCVFSVEHLSNLKCKGAINTYPITEAGDKSLLDELTPDLVISLGNNIASYQLKPFLRRHSRSIKHWAIDEGGRIRDMFNSLIYVFECTPSYFFNYFAKNALENKDNDREYYNKWKIVLDKMIIGDIYFSNFYVGKEIAKVIPDDSILHLAILNSIRIMQFFELKQNVKVFGNVGSFGIDGCLSTFMGQAVATGKTAVCIIGDLSFFYDMNAAGIKPLGSNVKIVLINNKGGSEFQLMMGKEIIPTIDKYICAQHEKKAQGWIESLGYKYYSASNKEELSTVLPDFMAISDVATFLEVYTDMELDANVTKEVYKTIKLMTSGRIIALKERVKSVLSVNQLNMVKKLLKRYTKK